jgi:hypothetical protein
MLAETIFCFGKGQHIQTKKGIYKINQAGGFGFERVLQNERWKTQ